jgi:hypothetical protein
MTARSVLLAGLAALAAMGAAAPAAQSAARDCGSLSFTPASEDGAFDIRARGTSCRTARRVARAAEPTSVTDGPFRFRARGFSCRGTVRDTALPQVRWRCMRGAAVVTFHRS